MMRGDGVGSDLGESMSILEEPAYPTQEIDGVVYPGILGRAYAAIQLCVPESGNAELDTMIRKAQRQRLAGMVLQGMIASESQGDGMCPPFKTGETWEPSVAARACDFADAMLAEQEKKR